MINGKTIVVRISPATAIIFSLIFSPAIIVGLAKIFESQIGAGLGICAIPLLLLYWICSPAVHLTDKTLTYHNGFTQRSIDLESIIKVEVIARPMPVIRLCQGRSKYFEFNLKPFSKNGAAFILHYIKSHVPNAQFDSISSNIEQGDFESVTRETLKLQNWIRFFATLVGMALTGVLIKVFLHIFYR
jgi:TM2 domain-containing membrane protein YozV